MKRLGFILLVVVFFIFGFLVFSYTCLLPFVVSNKSVISFAERSVKKYLSMDLYIENPVLKTNLNSDINFSVKKLEAKKNQKCILLVENFDGAISLKDVLKKKIKVYKLGAENFYADVNEIMKLFPPQNNTSSDNFDWKIDFYDSILYLNNSLINYTLDNGTNIELKTSNINVDNTQKIERFVHVNFDADIKRNDKSVKISFKDNDKIVIKNKHLYVNDCPLVINHSKMFFNAAAGRDTGFELVIYAKRFFIPDVIKLLQTNIIDNAINEPLEYVKNINGDFDFNVKITKDDLSGKIKLNKFSAKLFPLANMPFELTSGDIIFKKNDLLLKDFNGFYDNKRTNGFTFEGIVKDYLTTCDVNIDMITDLTNDLVGNYLSKVSGINLKLIGKSKSKILIHSRNTQIDVEMAGKIAKGDDILVEGASLSPVKFDRALKAVLHIDGDNLNIETINYYIAKELTKKSKGIKPILTLDGKLRISDAKVFDMGFDIPNPLPSEFLNVLVGQKLFKGGKFTGNVRYIDNGVFPVLAGKLQAEKIRIPTQRLFLNRGEISADDKLIKINANGKYRRSSYIFNGEILNAVKFPIVIKHTDLTVDDINIARLMKAFTAPVEKITPEAADSLNDDVVDDNPAMNFDISNIIIEESIVKIIKGSYKEIEFADVNATMSLNKDSIFKLKSNRFEIAEGHSSADVNCDLKNNKFNIRLGIKDVNVDTMSTALLNLPREITGKASGLIDLNTDESLKLNGKIKFIVKNGTIQKIGLVEYVLKFASLFRNPIAMISPSIFGDLVNIPEGNFDKITGDLKLKDNRIELLKIKSYSSQLSAYIVGCYNLENSDAILRIYTKFSNRNKGVAGILRNISLNSLANRIPLNSRNDANYYESELSQLPAIDADEKDCQIFLTKVDGDVEHNNFISSLKKIK